MHAAVLSLLRSQAWAELSLPAVARAAGIHPATLYRRWGTLPDLLDDVVSERLATGSPLPDTGTLRGDLETWAEHMAADLTSSDGRVLVRAAVLAAGSPDRNGPIRPYPTGRARAIEQLLERARRRGEAAPDLLAVFELLILPVYGYALFDLPLPPGRPQLFVDRLLTMSEEVHSE